MAGRRISCGVWIIAGMLAVEGVMAAGPFEAPKEGPVAFRRDRLPLDVETMTALSSDLVLLAQGQKWDNASDRRTMAQMFALALALNPANAEARTAVATAAKGKPPAKVTKRELERSRTQVWELLKWLASPASGTDGQALGACLGDVIAMSDPTNRAATVLIEGGEKGAWKSWIGDVKDFEVVQPADKQPIVEGKITPAPPEAPMVDPTETKLVLESASVATPLWRVEKDTGAESLQLITVGMKASVQPAAPPQDPALPVVKPMTFTVDFTPESTTVTRMNRDLHAILHKQYGTLPVGSQAVLHLGEDNAYLPLKDRYALSGPAGVLLGAALSGKEPTGIVIGKLEPDGSFKAQVDLWDRLRVLAAGGPGGRLVVPAEAAELLPWFLALEEPEFFLKYDILAASNYQELCERSAVATAGPLMEVLARFQEVRAKGASLPISQYVANRFVRQRLAELSAEAPYFISPKVLGIQGAGERPVKIPRKILAFELRRAIQPIGWLKGKASTEVDPTQLDRSYDLARAQVDRLERYTDDRDLLLRVRDMTTTLRTFSRAARISSSREKGPAMAADAFAAMRKEMTAVTAELESIIGETEVQEPPAPE